MAKFVSRNTRVFYGPYDLTGDSNSVTIDASADMVEVTTFCAENHTFIGGLKNNSVSLAGFTNYGESEKALFESLGSSESAMPLLVVPESESCTIPVDTVAYAMDVAEGEYSMSGSVGEVGTFSASFSPFDQSTLIRGKISRYNTGLTIADDGNVSNTSDFGEAKLEGDLYFISAHVTRSTDGANKVIKFYFASSETGDPGSFFGKIGGASSEKTMTLDANGIGYFSEYGRLSSDVYRYWRVVIDDDSDNGITGADIVIFLGFGT